MISTENLKLSAADENAVNLGDSNYINSKGAHLYGGDYASAVEYYHLAAAMGNVHAISNLGYCYLYGRVTEPNISLALAYFKTAALKGDVDAAYKLGSIYESDKWGLKDEELAVYYYRMAATYVLGEDWKESDGVRWCGELNKYPSLCYAMSRCLVPGGLMPVNLDIAYQFLMMAEAGYMTELTNGNTMYQESYEGVRTLMNDPMFDRVREKYDEDDEDDEDAEF